MVCDGLSYPKRLQGLVYQSSKAIFQQPKTCPNPKHRSGLIKASQYFIQCCFFFFIAVRQEVNTLDKLVVAHELEFVIKRAL